MVQLKTATSSDHVTDLRLKCVDCCDLLHGHGSTDDVGLWGFGHFHGEEVVLEELLSKA